MQKINLIIRDRMRLVQDVEIVEEVLAKNVLTKEETFYHILSERGVRINGEMSIPNETINLVIRNPIRILFYSRSKLNRIKHK